MNKIPSVFQIIWLNVIYPIVLLISWTTLILALIADLSSSEQKYDIWVIKSSCMLSVLMVNDIWQKHIKE